MLELISAIFAVVGLMVTLGWVWVRLMKQSIRFRLFKVEMSMSRVLSSD